MCVNIYFKNKILFYFFDNLKLTVSLLTSLSMSQYLLYASAASVHLSSTIHAKPSLNHKFSCKEFILREILK